MEILKSILLGIIEGITEFLPVSSTGHLILAHEFIGLEPASFQNAFDVIIQLGAILSVVVLYFHKLWPWSKTEVAAREGNLDHFTYTIRLWIKVIVGVLPSAILGVFLDDYIDAHFFNSQVVATTLILWGIIIIVVERYMIHQGRESQKISIETMTYKTAFLIGCFQCFALIPGTSRSAATIIGALILGMSRPAAAEFSFFLAIPTMVGATLLKIVKGGFAFSFYQWMVILVGLIISFITAYIVIQKFMGYVKRNNFIPFGIYRIILGILVLILLVL